MYIIYVCLRDRFKEFAHMTVGLVSLRCTGSLEILTN